MAKRASARKSEPADHVLRDENGRVLARYEPETGALHLSVAEGDLVLSAPKGRVRIAAGTDLELCAEERAHLHAPAIDVTSDVATLHGGEVSIVANMIRTTADEIATTAARWERRATRILEYATELYGEYEGGVHTRADSVRTIVNAAYQLLAKRASIASEEDTTIDGKRVLLG